MAFRPAKRTSKLLPTLARVGRTTLGPLRGQEKAPAMRGDRWSAARRRSASSLAVWGGGGPERAILAPSPCGVGPRTRIAPTGSSWAGRACRMVVRAGRWLGLPLGLVFRLLIHRVTRLTGRADG